MQNGSNQQPLANNHLSVDCVVLGFDGLKLKVLLVNRSGVFDGVPFSDRKLPGSVIYQDEDLDEAAARVLGELTGLSNVGLQQFKAYGSKDRTRNPRDVSWLEQVQNVHVKRIVTVAYLALVKIDRTSVPTLRRHNAEWVEIDDTGELAFDHSQIIADALERVRHYVDSDPSLLFSLLPRKFTALQLRLLYELIYGMRIDVRNFHKKISMMDYVVPLDEKEQGVAHRAARYYRFDRKIYNKCRR